MRPAPLLACVLAFLWLWFPARPAAAQETDDPPRTPAQIVGGEYLAGATAGFIVVPPMLLLGQKLGTLSSNLVAAALPPILLMAVVPPLAVTGAEFLVGRKLAPGTRFHPAIWGAVGMNVLVVVIGSLTGAWAGDGLSLGLFTLGEALLMPVAVTAIMQVTRRRPPKNPALSHAWPGPSDREARSAAVIDRPLSLGPTPFSVPVAGFSF